MPTPRNVVFDVLRRLGGRSARVVHRESRWHDLEAAILPTQRRAARDAIATRAVLATLRPTSNAIDVGANVGTILDELVRLAPQGSHMAFEAPLVRLDDVVLPEHPPSLVKIDVEGGELAVVRGAFQTLSRYQPTVLFEHGDGSADASRSDSTELFDVFAQCGLRIFDLDGVGPYSRDQFTQMFHVPVWDWLAVPDR